MLLDTTLIAFTAESKKERNEKVLNPPPLEASWNVVISNSLMRSLTRTASAVSKYVSRKNYTLIHELDFRSMHLTNVHVTLKADILTYRSNILFPCLV